VLLKVSIFAGTTWVDIFIGVAAAGGASREMWGEDLTARTEVIAHRLCSYETGRLQVLGQRFGAIGEPLYIFKTALSTFVNLPGLSHAQPPTLTICPCFLTATDTGLACLPAARNSISTAKVVQLWAF
jgi:hypothetical protein